MDSFDPFSRPEQGDRSLEDHTRLFLALANHTSYLDDTLCLFYDTTCRVLLSEDGPRESFATFAEWVLARNGSLFTIGPEGDLASPTPDPAPSPPSTRCMEHMPKSTETDEPTLHGS
ncbi:hypothetical protein M9458_021966, partial [Cirrhinus mrigala]